MAVEDAQVDTTKLDAERFGVIIGSGIGGMETIENQARVLIERGPSRVSPFTIPSLIANIASGVVAIEFQAKSVNFGVVSACASGSHALGEAMRHIRDGHADIMLSGGSEACITRLSYAGFCNMKAMSTDFNDTPEKASRPFDKLRDGFVMGEGAGVLVIESLEHAQARGARIYCELAGYGATCDAYHITGQDQEGKGLALCLNRALSEAGVAKSEVSYINAHGTSTPINDRCETLAIKRVFGEQAPKIAISSTKSMTGHLLGAAGGVEAAVCALAIRHGIVPPTLNLENPDPDCDLDYVPNQARKMTVNVAISNNLGFGGHNASLVFKAFK
jgi:3-oxoacyl-[acyl-carrier-protein] synthase II